MKQVMNISGFDYIVLHQWGDNKTASGIDDISLNSFGSRKDAVAFIKKDISYRINLPREEKLTKRELDKKIRECYMKGVGRNGSWILNTNDYYQRNSVWDYWEIRKIPHQTDSTWTDPDFSVTYKKGE